MSLRGKVAVVTGGNRGIGRAISLRLARDGALVAAVYRRNADAAALLVREVEAAGGEAFTVQADVGSAEHVRHLFHALDAELTKRRGSGRFDVLVNNAGVGRAGTVAATSEQDFEVTFAVNVRGPFFVTQQAIPRLRDGGRVINVSSNLSRRPAPEFAAYCMAKAALDAFTVALAAELGPRGITVNTLAPGLTATESNARLRQTPEAEQVFAAQTVLGRLGGAEDVAAVAAFLAGPDSGWVTGQYVEASGGWKLA
jgi:NAD(P)-dependent dehydrogenase (short-subunit alcohol dehydrogenase family)